MRQTLEDQVQAELAARSFPAAIRVDLLTLELTGKISPYCEALGPYGP